MFFERILLIKPKINTRKGGGTEKERPKKRECKRREGMKRELEVEEKTYLQYSKPGISGLSSMKSRVSNQDRVLLK